MEIKTAEEARLAVQVTRSKDPWVVAIIETIIAPKIDAAIAERQQELELDVTDDPIEHITIVSQVLRSLGYQTHIWLRDRKRVLVIVW